MSTQLDSRRPTPLGPVLCRYGDVSHSAWTLVCCLGAAEPSSCIAGWRNYLHPDVDFVVAERSGIGRRMSEVPLSDLKSVVDELVGALEPLINDKPIVLLGHSVGTLVSFRAASTLAASGHKQLALVVCNGRSPTVQDPIAMSEWSDDEIVTKLVQVRPRAQPLVARPDFLDLYLAAIRADLSLYASDERWKGRTESVRFPIFALGAKDDDLVPSAQMWKWSDLASGPFVYQIFSDGGHYLPIDDPPRFLLQLSTLLKHYFFAGE